jgi:hypothetical protein
MGNHRYAQQRVAACAGVVILGTYVALHAWLLAQTPWNMIWDLRERETEFTVSDAFPQQLVLPDVLPVLAMTWVPPHEGTSLCNYPLSLSLSL